MCTLSWQQDECGNIRIYFSRDEQRVRQQALAPETFLIDGVKCTMPIDPEGNGTWIAVNEYGIAICLLNYYQGDKPEGTLISRGALVKHLASVTSYSEAKARLNNYPLQHTAPFSMVLLCRDSVSPKVQRWVWDGRDLSVGDVAPPLVSAAKYFDEAYNYRKQLFDDLTKKLPRNEIGPRFHRSFNTHSPFLSPLMVREDARTVSITTVLLFDEEQQMHYESIDEHTLGLVTSRYGDMQHEKQILAVCETEQA
ncbi:NRDE family protein [Alteromonas sp. C1M14]|uniref:NRDE family protein n=1 Tax=Alteromonas sp. C1M14 TaxID=2841567 RepID=UPI001C09120B|nr:NRDE family protein [Alteromonas sp. C1M14]MBU2976841.1 NRDE family protein [Alteromonas sp. C1M14]